MPIHLTFFSPGTACLSHCPGGLELQCSCLVGGSLKHSNNMYINVCDTRITGSWYCCGISDIFLGLARLSFSACLTGEPCLLVLSSPRCPFHPCCRRRSRGCVALLSLQQRGAAKCHYVLGFGSLGSGLGWVLCSGFRRAETVIVYNKRGQNVAGTLRKGKLLLPPLRIL